jgi:hypothetical protein
MSSLFDLWFIPKGESHYMDMEIEADDLAHAKRIIRAKYPGARFLEIWEQVYHGDD